MHRSRRNYNGLSSPCSRIKLLIPSPQAEWTWRRSVLAWEERTLPRHAHVLAETRALLAVRHAHLSGHARDRSRIRCEAAGPHGLWLVQPSTRGGRLLTFVDLSGNAVREIAVPLGNNASLQLLHATSLAPGRSIVRGVHATGTSIEIDASHEPFGLVLHLPEEHRED